MNQKRLELVKSILEDESIAQEEEEAVHLLLEEQVTENSILQHDSKRTKGQQAADSLAKFAGSWKFIILFFCILTAWISINTLFLRKPFDAYPFILMNLLLSCLAAIQAPVIMMSQNRQEEKDRLRAKNDYKVNLKAEIIVEDIHNKLDSIIENQEAILKRLNDLEHKK
ncbi:MAG: hypothetical protein ABT01_00180 [Clostridium sp. SCN 57-10]|nr:MAG: hypothetical protein ABT01_00180 [Clostridium sp. SCN 57-10]